MSDDSYKGDLVGAQVRHATSMRCGRCLCGDLIGVDLLDEAGKTIAHGHLDIETAVMFGEMWSDAIQKALEAQTTH